MQPSIFIHRRPYLTLAQYCHCGFAPLSRGTVNYQRRTSLHWTWATLDSAGLGRLRSAAGAGVCWCRLARVWKGAPLAAPPGPRTPPQVCHAFVSSHYAATNSIRSLKKIQGEGVFFCRQSARHSAGNVYYIRCQGGCEKRWRSPYCKVQVNNNNRPASPAHPAAIQRPEADGCRRSIGRRVARARSEWR